MVCDVLLAPRNTLSNTSSFPASPVNVTAGLGVSLVEVPVPTAPPGVPSGVVWSTPAKFAAPAMMPLVTAPENVMFTVPAHRPLAPASGRSPCTGSCLH